MKLIKNQRLPGYNYDFYDNGLFLRWGWVKDQDPDFSPVGPEIADIEVSTICNGPNGTPCPWCYKSNTGHGENMSLETFINVFNKLNQENNLTQIAFGIGDINANPDLIHMFRWCRNNNVFPNLTVNGANLDSCDFEGVSYAQHIAELCGAVAVSHYGDDLCFNAVKKFTDLGMTQVNIHKILSDDTIDDCMDLIIKSKQDPRLKDLNAIVFLLLKPKGARNTMRPLTNMVKYKELINLAIEQDVILGFDSCGANKFLEAVKDSPQYKMYKMLAEPCESTCFSIYINVKGEMYPCSFGEGAPGWEKGINVVEAKDFLTDVWMNPRVTEWREKNIKNCRNCVFYDL